MDVVEIRQSAVDDFKSDCIETCNEIQEVVSAWIECEKKKKTSILHKANIDVEDFECDSVNYVIDQDGVETFLIYCDGGDDSELAYEIMSMVLSKTGVDCACIIR